MFIKEWTCITNNLHSSPRFPHSQHQTSLIHIGIQIIVIWNCQKPRWNLRKNDWEAFTTTLKKSAFTIPLKIIPIDDVYSHFQKAVLFAASRLLSSVHTGQKCTALQEEYETSCDPDTIKHLLESLNVARSRWKEVTAQLNFVIQVVKGGVFSIG